MYGSNDVVHIGLLEELNDDDDDDNGAKDDVVGMF